IHVVKELNVYLKASRKLAQELEHDPTAEEIAHSMDKTVADVSRMFRLNERVSSVDVPLGKNGERTLVETLADSHPCDPEELVEGDDLSSSVEACLSELSDKQREVIARRFGLRGHDTSTLEEVGREIGLTRERVRQIQVEALHRLRDIMQKQGLDGHILFEDS
ncbi:MAG: sigma-70 domain-containing protein, partial [Porticoccus sp.]